MDSTVTPEKPVTHQPRSRRSRVIGTIIAILAMVGLGALAWHLTHQAPAPGAGQGGGGRGRGAGGPGGGGFGGRGGMPATTVGVATAERADIPVYLDSLGTVTATATTTVRAQVSGVLQKVNYSEGQLVHAGQVLATIDPRSFQIALMQASGQRQRDEAQLDSARVTLGRYQTLLKEDSIARQDVDTQAALVKQLEGTVMTDRANENMAKLNLNYSQVKAPISGRVGLRTVDVGNLVGSNDANGVAVITQLSPIDVQFTVPQDQLPLLQARIRQAEALPATALDRTRTDTLAAGRFVALDNQVDVQTGTVKAKARFDNNDNKMFPSQFVNLRLKVDTIKNAVVVPVTAVRHGADGDYVYVLNGAQRTVSLRPVTRGQQTVDKIELRSGVQAGEQVITEGADRLKEGAKVVLPGDRPQMGGPGGGQGGRHGRGGQGGQGGQGAQGAQAPQAGQAAPGGADAAGGHRRWQNGADAGQPGAPDGQRRHRRDGQQQGQSPSQSQ
ncbi:MdtA/MuxA family multidrug efflux RND transporter periplasmic adaptor subunit [Massilia terrae]|uniref:MdtA/MuxA family multidrug efflux RND transporter periplasmic adaptor subunit n=1 Tax=Massilia terrae TaxID=1811224 RepID=A0ABT2CRN3_9BURK|nr:MdtA/MuxA family multidrug efflux RND transporter periplasmic adaptor subunit [Massilia terrae]MCS0656619.1 MdtA/MuxA family multidrug efflux RND transporter periplasmic adaptor subunit [Massilia terrae]